MSQRALSRRIVTITNEAQLVSSKMVKLCEAQ